MTKNSITRIILYLKQFINKKNADMDIIFTTKLIETAQLEGVKKLSVGGALLNDGKLLILKRCPDDFMPNIYELPGGGLENDESLIQALEREILEETNCRIEKIIGYIGHIDFLSSTGLLTRRFNFLVQPKLPLAVQLTEHQSYEWILPCDAANYDITPQTHKMITLVNDGILEKKLLLKME